MMNKALLLSLFTLFAFCAKAQDLAKYGVDTTKTVPEGLPVGSYAPVFDTKDALGNDYSLQTSLSKGPVVLVFFRGEWCPHCNRYMSALEDSLSYIREAGAEVVALSPEANEHIIEMVGENGAEFRVLHDIGGAVMRDYEVAFNVTGKYEKKIKRFLRAEITERNEQENAVLPVPAVFIISQSGRIAWRYFNYDYKQRPSIQSILTALSEL